MLGPFHGLSDCGTSVFFLTIVSVPFFAMFSIFFSIPCLCTESVALSSATIFPNSIHTISPSLCGYLLTCSRLPIETLCRVHIYASSYILHPFHGIPRLPDEFYAHRNCCIWSPGVVEEKDNSLAGVVQVCSITPTISLLSPFDSFLFFSLMSL